jgi:hypothetical protein
MTVRTTFAVLSVLALAACQPATDDALDSDSLTMDDLAITVDTAIDEVDADAEGDESTDVVMDLEVAEEDLVPDRPGRRAVIKTLVRRLAEDEPCALRGVLAGRYHRFEDATDALADGAIRGRAFRRGDGLIARGAGTYTSAEEPGGTFAADWVNFEGNTGTADGTYAPQGVFHDIRLGTFEGTWDGDDGPGFGNLGGLWHPTRDGRGLFVGYWSNCNTAPLHDAAVATVE